MRGSFSPFELGLFREASHVAVMQAFFDASENGGYLVVAGYLFRKKHIQPFEKRWREMLRKHGLEYFHMTDCNAGADQFAKMGKDERIACQTLAISAITDFATVGIVNGVSLTEFREVMGDDGYMNNAFSLCAHGALMMCKAWAEENDPVARIGYVFEAGDTFMGDANNILNAIAEDPRRRAFFHYNGHAFVPKRGSMPTQAADILAWHGCKHHERSDRGITRMRGDFAELVSKVPTSHFFNSRKEIERVATIAQKHLPFERAPKVAGLAMRMNKSNARQVKQELSEILIPQLVMDPELLARVVKLAER